jgi:hypothetical protein
MYTVRSTLRVGFILLATALAHGALAQAPPAAPQVTAGAELKRLVFDWDTVAGATHYQLLEKPNGWASEFTLIRDGIPATRTRIRVPVATHFIYWHAARYIIAACNEAGCTHSAEIPVDHLELDAMGYVKASNTQAGDRFGRQVVLSSDGQTLAVTAQNESSNATGVNGDQSNDGSPSSGAVYVYRRESGQWRQEAYLKAGVNVPQQYFGTGQPIESRALAVSRDGSVIAVGAPGQAVSGSEAAGAVYIYNRGEDGSWTLATTLHASELRPGDYFGISVDLSLDARTLKVSSLQPQDGEGNFEGRTHIYRHNENGWRHSATLAPFHAGDLCATTRLSGDGRILASYCISYSTGAMRLVTQQRDGNTWTHLSDLNLQSFTMPQALALNYDGTFMALRHPQSWLPAGVFIYRRDGTTWFTEINFPAAVNDPGASGWSESLAFNRDGTLLAVGNPAGAWAGEGVLSQYSFESEHDGSVALLLREEQNPERWSERVLIKAPNPGGGDLFGDSVSLSGNGLTLAVGAPHEDGGATGIDGDRTDESAAEAGAAYLY